MFKQSNEVNIERRDLLKGVAALVVAAVFPAAAQQISAATRTGVLSKERSIQEEHYRSTLQVCLDKFERVRKIVKFKDPRQVVFNRFV